MMDISTRRRLFAEEVEAVANLRTQALVEALASVPREQFLPPGPWAVCGEGDFAKARRVPDLNPAHAYHNYSIAIDTDRQLFNGPPSTIAAAIDALALQPGDRVLHIGAGLGYYSAILGHTVGSSGQVLAVEIDSELAAQARRNVATMPWVTVHNGGATESLDGIFDAILVNVGVTHPQSTWLDALVPGGRMIMPLTAMLPGMEGTLGKGIVTLLTKDQVGAGFDVRVVTFISIYSGVGLRDERLNAQLGKALAGRSLQTVTRLRRDPHEIGASCRLHAPNCCFGSA